MKRIGIFVFYDSDGIVDDFKLYLLESLKSYISNFIIVVNGKIQKNGFDKLLLFSDHIFIRKNMGYDCGAYKDVLMGKYGYIDWQLWDEIILFNDTFYGPLFTWENVFCEMENGGYDFWGLSRHTGGMGILLAGAQTPEHIQCYFLAIGKKLFSSSQWMDFWQQLNYPMTYLEAIEKFEIRFTSYFSSRGFSFSTWLDRNGGSDYVEEGINPYLRYAYEIVKYASFPIIKCKSLSLIHYRNTQFILQYVKNHTSYNRSLILQHLKRMEKTNCLKPFGVSELQHFIATHRKIYIFGHGEYGRGLEEYFQIKGWKLSGFVVSNPQSYDDIGLQGFTLEKTDGLIVALGIAYTKEIRPILEERFEKEQLLFSR